jgi:putative transposase
LDKTLTLRFLDQCGFSLMLTLCYTWFKRGTGLQFQIPTRWGSQGRINLIGSLSLFGTQETLEIRELEGTCKQAQVIAYLDSLAGLCVTQGPTTVVLDNATFHKGDGIRERKPLWEQQGLVLRYLPPYCPSLNLIEGVWRRVKGFLMPRRCYNSLVELREALWVALKALNVVII